MLYRCHRSIYGFEKVTHIPCSIFDQGNMISKLLPPPSIRIMEKRLVVQAKEGVSTIRQPIWFSFENSLEVFPLSFLHIQADPGEKALGRKGQCSLDSPLSPHHPLTTDCLWRLWDPSPPCLVFLLSPLGSC